MARNLKYKKVYSVTTMTPHRISFAGGGTDYPDYYKKKGGVVLNTTINKYLFVTVKKHGEIFPEKYRLMYSKTEKCNKISEIKNNIARECLKLLPVKGSISISTTSDLPPESGAGSSSCFAVGLLNALHSFRGERVTSSQLAREACQIEINKLKKTSGKQDQYAATYGGMNKFLFKKNGKISIVPVKMFQKAKISLFDNLKMIWTGQKRDASKIAKTYNFKKETFPEMEIMKEMTKDFKMEFEKKKLNLENIKNLIQKSWLLKKRMSKSISPTKINKFSNKLSNLKISGHRLLGAGGGGFFLCLANKNQVKTIKKNFPKSKLISINYEPHGSKVVSLIYN